MLTCPTRRATNSRSHLEILVSENLPAGILNELSRLGPKCYERRRDGNFILKTYSLTVALNVQEGELLKTMSGEEIMKLNSEGGEWE